MAWLRSLGWRQFEQLVAQAYRLQGYQVMDTALGADGGIDLILVRGPERIFVQCKAWNAWQVGVHQIREFFGVMVAGRATGGIFVTSGRFSQDAVLFARQVNMTLVNGPELLSLLASGTHSAAPPPPAAPHPVAPTLPSGTPTCPACLAPMVLRKARRGPTCGSRFWGCSRYPTCRMVLDAGTALTGGPRPAAPSPIAPPSRPTFGTPATNLGSGGRPGAGPRAAALVGRVLIAGVGAVVTMTLVASLPMVLGSLRSAPLAPRAGVQGSAAPVGPTSAQPTAAAQGGVAWATGGQPMDIAVDQKGDRVYTANFDSGDVTVLSAGDGSLVRTIDVPGQPSAVAVDHDRHLLYVTDYNRRKVHVVSLTSQRVVATFATGADPSDLAIDTARHELFVANGDGRSVTVFDTRSNRRVRSHTTPGVRALALDAPRDRLYLLTTIGILPYRASSFEGLPTYFDLGSTGIAVDARRHRLYKALQHGGLVEINLLTGKQRTVAEGVEGTVAVDPDRRMAYLADPETDRVTTVSLR